LQSFFFAFQSYFVFSPSSSIAPFFILNQIVSSFIPFFFSHIAKRLLLLLALYMPAGNDFYALEEKSNNDDDL
jgi:hypothetical protein